jgi:hypothetical protein
MVYQEDDVTTYDFYYDPKPPPTTDDYVFKEPQPKRQKTMEDSSSVVSGGRTDKVVQPHETPPILPTFTSPDTLTPPPPPPPPPLPPPPVAEDPPESEPLPPLTFNELFAALGLKLASQLYPQAKQSALTIARDFPETVKLLKGKDLETFKAAIEERLPQYTEFEEPPPDYIQKIQQQAELETKIPKVDEPKVDEPKIDEPKVDEPTVTEPTVTEPKATDAAKGTLGTQNEPSPEIKANIIELNKELTARQTTVTESARSSTTQPPLEPDSTNPLTDEQIRYNDEQLRLQQKAYESIKQYAPALAVDTNPVVEAWKPYILTVDDTPGLTKPYILTVDETPKPVVETNPVVETTPVVETKPTVETTLFEKVEDLYTQFRDKYFPTFQTQLQEAIQKEAQALSGTIIENYPTDRPQLTEDPNAEARALAQQQLDEIATQEAIKRQALSNALQEPIDQIQKPSFFEAIQRDGGLGWDPQQDLDTAKSMFGDLLKGVHVLDDLRAKYPVGTARFTSALKMAGNALGRLAVGVGGVFLVKDLADLYSQPDASALTKTLTTSKLVALAVLPFTAGLVGLLMDFLITNAVKQHEIVDEQNAYVQSLYDRYGGVFSPAKFVTLPFEEVYGFESRQQYATTIQNALYISYDIAKTIPGLKNYAKPPSEIQNFLETGGQIGLLRNDIEYLQQFSHDSTVGNTVLVYTPDELMTAWKQNIIGTAQLAVWQPKLQAYEDAVTNYNNGNTDSLTEIELARQGVESLFPRETTPSNTVLSYDGSLSQNTTSRLLPIKISKPLSDIQWSNDATLNILYQNAINTSKAYQADRSQVNYNLYLAAKESYLKASANYDPNAPTQQKELAAMEAVLSSKYLEVTTLYQDLTTKQEAIETNLATVGFSAQLQRPALLADYNIALEQYTTVSNEYKNLTTQYQDLLNTLPTDVRQYIYGGPTAQTQQTNITEVGALPTFNVAET